MTKWLTGCAIVFLNLVVGAAQAADAPKFQVDPAWPKPLPNNWIMGQAAGVAVDAQDHVWVVQRPKTLTDDEKAASLSPPRTKCCVAAPPVMEFDQEGNLIKAWGGKGEGFDWPDNEHGIYIDQKGFVWLAGNGERDGQILKFTRDGKFVMQIGKQGNQTDSQDTTRLGKPANMTVDATANEIYVADGYFNHRVIVFDSETGAFKRQWGAYGKPSTDVKMPAYDPSAPPSPQFGNPVHCVRIASDGLVYVCDRMNDRIQVFRKDGTFVKEMFVEKNTLANGSVWDLEIGRTRARPSCSTPTAPTTRSARCRVRPAKPSAASAATAAWPATSTGFTIWRSTPRATSSPPRSIPASARKSSCSRETWC